MIFNKIFHINNRVLCANCKLCKVNINEEICPDCKLKVDIALKLIKSTGYLTWPILRHKLKVNYAGTFRTLEYLVKKKILLPPDDKERYYLAK
jgi:predicted HTH transcriptional regulator